MPNDRYSGVMGRVLIVLALGFLAGLVIPAACHGQEGVAQGRAVAGQSFVWLGHSGSPGPGTPQPLPPISPLHQNSPRDRTGVLQTAPTNIAHSVPKYNITLPLGAVGLGYLGGMIDHDAGGYRDSFKFQPDKQAHFLASVVLAKAVADGTSVKLGFATCLLAGLAWEAGQARHHGFASTYDATYDLGGCAAGALWGRK